MREFGGALKTALTGRAQKVVFFAADGELPFDKVVDFMDVVRNSGAENLGIVFDDLKSGPAARRQRPRPPLRSRRRPAARSSFIPLVPVPRARGKLFSGRCLQEVTRRRAARGGCGPGAG